MFLYRVTWMDRVVGYKMSALVVASSETNALKVIRDRYKNTENIFAMLKGLCQEGAILDGPESL